jgi:putative addiction module killer protein
MRRRKAVSLCDRARPRRRSARLVLSEQPVDVLTLSEVWISASMLKRKAPSPHHRYCRRDRLGALPCTKVDTHGCEPKLSPDIFPRWLGSLRDAKAAAKIAQRIVRVQSGLSGDVKPIGEGISELRVNFGPGYRLYFVQRGKVLIILLCGGDKSTQARDIRRAKELSAGL